MEGFDVELRTELASSRSLRIVHATPSRVIRWCAANEKDSLKLPRKGECLPVTPMRASFWTLYKRGRLAAHGLSEEEQMQQRERFGVACFALCLKRERALLRGFLELCGLKTPDTLWQVSVDPYSEKAARWADILLQNSTHVIVIECKVHDALDPKQNPWKDRDTFLAPNTGYGWYFAERFSDRKRIYVTLTESSVYPRQLIDGTECLALTWTQIRALSCSSDWIRDLFVSLGYLDYTSFRSMKTGGYHVETIVPALTSMEVLTSVATRLGLRDFHVTHEVEESENDGRAPSQGFVGVEISRFSKAHAARHSSDIKDLLQPLWDTYFGWFGYVLNTTPTGPRTDLGVWFYCKSKRGSDAVKAKLENVSGWIITPAGTDKPDEKNFVAAIKQMSSGRDEDDFMNVLTPVFPEIGGKGVLRQQAPERGRTGDRRNVPTPAEVRHTGARDKHV